MYRRVVLGAFVVAAIAVSMPVVATDEDNGSGFSTPAEVGTQGTQVTRNDPWVALPPCPHGESRPAGAVVGDHFFVVGGEPRDGYVQEYDPGTGLWDDTNALMPTPASNICAAVIGTEIYVPGGYDGVNYLSQLQVYDTVGDAWSVVATDPLPVELSGPACAAYGGKIYVFGGRLTADYVNTTYIYDPAAAAGSRWTTGASAPIIGGYGDAIAAGSYLYWAGMRNSIADLADVYRYDPAGDTWTAMPSLTTPRGAARMWTYEGNLAVGGGGWSTYLSTVEEYDLSAGTGGSWTAGNGLVTGSRTFAAAQDDVTGVLYKGAGWNGSYQTDAESSAYVIPVELMEFNIE